MTQPLSRLRRAARSGSSFLVGAGLAVALTFVAAAFASGSPQTTARDLFLAAQARERPIRLALASSPPEPAPSRDAMRQVVVAYQQVVLSYPTSGYCDNALWLAARLSAETFSRHRDEHDRKTAIQLLKSLVSEYPSSSFVAQARADLVRLATPEPPVEPGEPAPAPAAGAARTGIDAAPTGGLVLVTDVRRQTTADGSTVEIQLDGPIEYREERLEKPARVFFDLANTRTMEALRDATLAFESGTVRGVRVGRRPNDTTRVVIETVDAARCVSRLASNPHRLVVACREESALPARAPSPEPAVEPERQPVGPVPVMPGSAAVSAGRSEPEAKRPDPAPRTSAAAPDDTSGSASTPAPAAPAANGRGGFSMARQLGLRVGRIVIDAGHGGRDPGASGPGYSESAMTLDIALRLEKLLAKEPGVEVVLTRRKDEYVALQERTAIANREGADLFVSIHANASRNRSARGVESYLLNFASTPEAAAVAARENASSTLTMSHLNDLVKQIALNSKLDESRDLAGHLQNALVKKLRSSNQQLRDLGVKQAPFVVLVGAAMPSVLVEVAFLTHKQEGRLLGTGAYRQRIAEALLDGVRRYLRTLKRAETDAGGEPAPEPLQLPLRLQ